MTHKPPRLFCRILAASAWLATLAFFGLAIAASWGFLPGAMLMWSVLALPLAALTRRWLAAAGVPVAARVQRRVVRVWQVLAIGFLASYGVLFLPPWSASVGERLVWWIYFPLAVPYGVFPLVLTGLVLWRVARPTAPTPGAPAV